MLGSRRERYEYNIIHVYLNKIGRRCRIFSHGVSQRDMDIQLFISIFRKVYRLFRSVDTQFSIFVVVLMKKLFSHYRYTPRQPQPLYRSLTIVSSLAK